MTTLTQFPHPTPCLWQPPVHSLGFPGSSTGKDSTCNVGYLGWEDPLEEGMATHSSILAWRIPTDRGAWWATVHGVAKSRTWLRDSAYNAFSVSMSLLFIDSTYEWDYTLLCFLIWLISLSIMPSQSLSMLLQVSGFPSFSWLNSIQLCAYIPHFSLLIHLSMHTNVVFMSWLL